MKDILLVTSDTLLSLEDILLALQDVLVVGAELGLAVEDGKYLEQIQGECTLR